MSRRATNADSTHHRRVKEEKIKVKEERNKGKQRARVDEEEEEQRQPPQDPEGDEDAAGEPDDEEEAGSPRGAKRIRVNGDGDSAPGGSQNDDEPPLPKVKTLPRGSDG
jgi:structural maintenance of chromosomes protein 5